MVLLRVEYPRSILGMILISGVNNTDFYPATVSFMGQGLWHHLMANYLVAQAGTRAPGIGVIGVMDIGWMNHLIIILHLMALKLHLLLVRIFQTVDDHSSISRG